jgi:hypothetical protein
MNFDMPISMMNTLFIDCSGVLTALNFGPKNMVAIGYGLHERGGLNSSLGRVKNFVFSISSRPALGSTQPNI